MILGFLELEALLRFNHLKTQKTDIGSYCLDLEMQVGSDPT